MRGLLALVIVPCLFGLGACTPAEIDPDERDRALDDVPIVAEVLVDPATATVGDPIRFELRVDYLDGVDFSLPDTGPDFAGLEIVDSGSETTAGDGRSTRLFWYELRADHAGSFVVAPVVLLWTQGDTTDQSLETNEVFIEIESVLPTDVEAEDIRDIKPLQRIPTTRWWWLALLALLAFALVSGFLFFRKQGEDSAPSAPTLLPHEIAYRELDRLRRTDFRDLEALHEYYYAISQVVRTYVEGRFGLNATDLTTQEISDRLPSLAGLGMDQAAELELFLESSDQVKYAKHLPETSEIESNYERAVRFVEQTAPSFDLPEEKNGSGAPSQAAVEKAS